MLAALAFDQIRFSHLQADVFLCFFKVRSHSETFAYRVRMKPDIADEGKIEIQSSQTTVVADSKIQIKNWNCPHYKEKLNFIEVNVKRKPLPLQFTEISSTENE